MADIHAYIYLGVTFMGPRFSLQKAVFARLSRGYAALKFSKDNIHICSSKSHKLNCGYLIDTFVTPTLLHGVQTWRPSLNKENSWKDVERSLVSITHIISSKAFVPP